MRTNEWETSARVVEFGQVFPLFCGVTGDASEWLTRLIRHRHARCELAFVHVFMTGCAGKLTEVEQHYFRTECGFVTFDAGNGFMASRKREDGLLVFCKSVV
jgi:hypothetical protein